MLNIKDQKFGIEFEFTGMTREHAAKVIQTVIGGNVVYDGGTYRTYTVVAPDGRKWKVMSDSSIRCEGHEIGGCNQACEFVTPICTFEDIQMYQACIRALRHAKAKINTSCGIHIHIDAANHDARSLKNLAFLFKARQDMIFKAVGTQQRRLYQWCKPLDDAFIVEMQNKCRGDFQRDDVADVWYSSYSFESRSNHYNNSRYHALNYHSVFYRGTVEFRCFEATLHAGEIRAWLMLCLGMSAYAINKPGALRPRHKDVAEQDEKYFFRTFLWYMGFCGDEYKNVRANLLKNLHGEEYHHYKPRRTASNPAPAEVVRRETLVAI